MLAVLSVLLLLAVEESEATCPGMWSAAVSQPQCELELNAGSSQAGYTSPCFPDNYPDNLTCSSTVIANGGNLTQIILSSFVAESWADYLKLSGSNGTNFFLFVDAAQSRLLITGYPLSNLTATFVSDASTHYSGFNGSYASVSESQVLEQYHKYANLSAVQILTSPFFITSAGDVQNDNALNVLLITIDNTSVPLGEAWEEYAGLISNSTTVNSFARTTTGFTVNWTSIAGALYYNIAILHPTITSAARLARVNSTYYVAKGLPSGSYFAVVVTAVNKAGTQRNLGQQHYATTDMTSPSLSSIRAGQTEISLEWTEVPGALRYEIAVLGESISYNQSFTIAKAKLSGLNPGERYDIELVTVFLIGKTAPLRRYNILTAPGNVSGIVAVNVTTTSAVIQWSSAGVEHYLIQLMFGGKVIRATILGNATSYHYFFLKVGNFHEVSITALNWAGRLAVPQTIQFATAVSAPTNIRVTKVAQNSIDVEWSNATGAPPYEVTSYPVSNVMNKRTTNTTSTTFKVTQLDPGTAYVVAVAAVYPAGKSARIWLEQVTLPGNARISISQITTSSAKVSWTWPPSVTYFIVRLTPGEERNLSSSSTIFSGLSSGKNYTAHVTAHSDVGSSHEAQAFSTIPDKCEGKKCAANATCLTSGACQCAHGFFGDPDELCEAFCQNQTIRKDGRNLTFITTRGGAVAYSNEKCTGGSPRSRASATCVTITSNAGTFVSMFAPDSVVVIECNETVESITGQLSATENITAEELEETSAALQVITSGEKLPQNEVDNVANYMENVTKIAEEKDVVTEEVFRGIANTVDNLVESQSLATSTPPPAATPAPGGPTAAPVVSTTKSPEEVHRKDVEIKKKILKSLSQLAQHVIIPNKTNEVVIVGKNMIIKVSELKPSSNGSSGPSYHDESFAPGFVEKLSGDDEPTDIEQPMNITIPSTAFVRAESEINRGNTTTKALRISFFLHKDASLFPSKANVSKVISATLGDDLKLTNLHPEIKIEHNREEKPGKFPSRPLHVSPVETVVCAILPTKTFYHDQDELVQLKCVFWDFNLNSWSRKGCRLAEASAPPTCLCDHLTNFALVVSKTEVPADVALEIVSDIGCCLSIIGLFFTIVVHLLKKEIRNRRPTIILIHVCSNLLLSYTVFVIGVELTGNFIACAAITALLHFLMLSAWTWMAVYTHDMYRSLVKVFSNNVSNYLTKCTLFAYGAPLAIVVLNTAITMGYVDMQSEFEEEEVEDLLPQTSAYKADNMCWLHDNSLYFGFLLPVGLMLIFNFVIYAFLVRSVVWNRGKVQSSAAKVTTRANLMISITLASTTGVTWVLGYLMLLSDDLLYLQIMSWLFCIANTSQGFIIFLLTCFRNETLRNIWWGPIRKRLPRRGYLNRLLPGRGEWNPMEASRSSGVEMSTSGERSTAVTKFKSTTDASATALAADLSVDDISEANVAISVIDAPAYVKAEDKVELSPTEATVELISEVKPDKVELSPSEPKIQLISEVKPDALSIKENPEVPKDEVVTESTAKAEESPHAESDPGPSVTEKLVEEKTEANDNSPVTEELVSAKQETTSD